MKWLNKIIDFFKVGLTKENYITLKNEIQIENFKNLLFISNLASILTFLIYILSFWIKELEETKILFFSFSISLLVINLIARYFSRHTKHVIIYDVYAFMTLLIIYSIIISTHINSDKIAVAFIAFILSLPLFFIDLPYRMCIFIILSTIVFIINVLLFDNSSIRNIDIMDSIIFSIVSIITSTYTIKMKFQNIYMKSRYHYFSETDVLTEMKNRNSFEHYINSIDATDNTYCIFLDVNGLHELNNIKGHKSGDCMLVTVAKYFKKAFGSEHSYRIGGDEFVAFVEARQEDDIIQDIKLLQDEINNEGYSVSIGFAKRKAYENLEGLVKLAEINMYEDKRRYYSHAKHNRRSSMN